VKNLIKIKRKRIITLISIFVLVSIISGFLFYNVRANGKTNEEELFANLEPFFEALNLVRFEYIKKDIDLNKVIRGAIQGMLKTLDDPYTRYMDSQALKIEQEDMFLGHFG